MFIDKISTVSLFVENQDRAKDWYTNVLGFKVRTDMPMGPDSRWISVVPAENSETELILYKVDQNWEHYKQVVGKSQAITFNVPNMNALVSDLKAKGVQFIQEPDPQPWGTYATIKDSEGNSLILVEPPKGY